MSTSRNQQTRAGYPIMKHVLVPRFFLLQQSASFSWYHHKHDKPRVQTRSSCMNSTLPIHFILIIQLTKYTSTVKCTLGYNVWYQYFKKYQYVSTLVVTVKSPYHVNEYEKIPTTFNSIRKLPYPTGKQQHPFYISICSILRLPKQIYPPLFGILTNHKPDFG